MMVAGFREYQGPPPMPPGIVAVYILVCNGSAVYVGQTINLDQRMRSHYSKRKHKRGRRGALRFDRVIWLSVEHGDLLAYEGALARALNPSHTHKVNGDKSRDAEILGRLGVVPDETKAFERRVSERFAKQWRAVRLQRKRWAKRRAKDTAQTRAFAEAA